MRRFSNMSDPLVPSEAVMGLVKLIQHETGLEPKALLCGLQDKAQPAWRGPLRVSGPWSFRQLDVLVRRCFELTDEPDLGLRFGALAASMSPDLLDDLLSTAPTVGQAVMLRERFGALWQTHVEFVVVPNDGGMSLQILPRVRLVGSQVQRFGVETIMAAVHVRMKKWFGGEHNAKRIAISYEPPAYVEDYTRIFGDALEFGAPVLEFSWTMEEWQRPLPGASIEKHSLAMMSAEQDTMRRTRQQNVVSRVRSLLRECEGELPDARRAAQALMTSERSLRRDLRDTGASYQSLLDEARQALVMRHLFETDMSMEAVARLAGFADGRSFRRAFKRWTGITPVQARRQRGIARPFQQGATADGNASDKSIARADWPRLDAQARDVHPS